METNLDNRPTAFDLAYARYRAPDLEVMTTFLSDFGLTVQEHVGADGVRRLFSKGVGGTPYVHIVEEGPAEFLGVGFEMTSMAGLEAVSKKDGASEIEEIDAPGAGLQVRFEDENGYRVDAVYGWVASNTQKISERVSLNTMASRQRFNDPVRLNRGPVDVQRIGHCVIKVKSFRESERWFKERFGMITTEEIYLGEPSNVVGAFLRIDGGERPTDHHTLFLFQADTPGNLHTAFEVSDWDSVMLGHDYLKSKGYMQHWGVGKHVLGSQVFDYWEDPYGNVVEHFTDSDLFDADHPVRLEPLENVIGVQWGPQPPYEGPPE
ncbi:MAG: VOC family protein [Pseudomonadota bacterium]